MTSPRDWGDGLFVIVYAEVARDHPSIWNDLYLSGAWVHCLLTARAMRGAPFTPPREVPDEAVAALIADDVLDPVGGGRYLFHGLDRETEGLTSRGSAGGRARATAAARIGGRFAPASVTSDAPAFTNGSPANPTSDAPATDTSAHQQGNAGQNAGHQRTSETRQDKTSSRGVPTAHTPTSSESKNPRARDDRPGEETPNLAGVGLSRAEVGGGRYGTPNVPTCADPESHGTRWRYVGGVGWRCLVCDGEKPGDRSFREKARDAGADV